MNTGSTYPVLSKAREFTEDPDLDALENRKYLGIPLANDMRRWLAEQPPDGALCLDFTGVKAINLSVAEELGPLFLQTVSQAPELERHYPIYRLAVPEPAYTVAGVFDKFNAACLAFIPAPHEPLRGSSVVANFGAQSVAVLGQLSPQMIQILAFADKLAQEEKDLTSEDLTALDFLQGVSPAARSKRLSELYARRLLAFRENPENHRERLFFPPWRLYDQRSTAH